MANIDRIRRLRIAYRIQHTASSMTPQTGHSICETPPAGGLGRIQDISRRIRRWIDIECGFYLLRDHGQLSHDVSIGFIEQRDELDAEGSQFAEGAHENEPQEADESAMGR